jgi:hypothetical protein
MNLFAVIFAVCWLSSFGLDYAKWKKREVENVSKTLYVSINAAILVLFAAYVANIRVPMPTQLFIRYIAPWVRSALRSTFDA